MTFNKQSKSYHLLRALRPRQWIKNGLVFAPIVFQGKLFELEYLYKETLAFICFSLAASAIYLINDIKDVEKDRVHPIKRNRPIAAGNISVQTAKVTAYLLFIISIPVSYFIVGKYFSFVIVVYIILQILYSQILKNMIIIDALTIAIGFILRVFAGALAIPISISSWLVLAVTGVSLLLAFGKRRAERTLLESKNISKESTRKILKHYPDSLLDSMISMSSSFSIITYSLFAFFAYQIETEDRINVGSILRPFLPSTLAGAKLLMLTIPIVIYCVGRYLYVIYEKREGESPERIILQDKPLFYSAILWGIVIVLITS